MNFESLHFHERDKGYGAELGITVHGYWVPKSVFELTQQLIKTSFSTLIWEKPLKVNAICFHPEWNSWKCGLRIKIGRCVVHFVEMGMLPLTITNPGKKGPRRYKRT